MMNKKLILIIIFGIISCDRNEKNFKTSLAAKLDHKVKLPCFVEKGHKFIWMRSDHNQLISVGEIVMANRQAFRIETECEKTESSIAFGCWVYLIIDKLELSDEGVYVCQKDTMHSNYINLTILVPPYIKNEADSSMDIEVVEGSDVELVCDAYGKPDPTIKWFAKNEYYITSEKFLIIKNASRHSIKEYECIADNGVNPSISRTFSLRILFSPSIIHFELDKSIFKNAGRKEIIKLSAKFMGNPMPKFKWIIDGYLKNTSIDFYHLSNDSKQDNQIFFASIEIYKINTSSLIEFKVENELGASNSSFRLKNIEKFSKTTLKNQRISNLDKKRTILSNASTKNVYIGHKTLINNMMLDLRQQSNDVHLNQNFNFILTLFYNYILYTIFLLN